MKRIPNIYGHGVVINVHCFKCRQDAFSNRGVLPFHGLNVNELFRLSHKCVSHVTYTEYITMV